VRRRAVEGEEAVEAVEAIKSAKTPKVKTSKSHKEFRDALTEALMTCGKVIRVRNDGPKVKAVNLSYIEDEFNKRHAISQKDRKKRAEAQRKAFERVLNSLPSEYSTWVDGDNEWIWRNRDEKPGPEDGHGHSDIS
jgi:hypothetical protein